MFGSIDWCTSIIYHTIRPHTLPGSLLYFVTRFVSSFLSRCSAWIRIEQVPIWSSLYRFWIWNLKWIRCLVNSQYFVVETICPTYPDTFPHLMIRVCSKTKMELSLSWIWGALATTTARAGNENVPSYFFAFISVNSLKMANIGELEWVLGTAPKFGLKKLNLSLCLRPSNNVAKGNLRWCSYRL